jgi:hypothetical protein
LHPRLPQFHLQVGGIDHARHIQLHSAG